MRLLPIKQALADLLIDLTGVKTITSEQFGITPKVELGDFAYPCFDLARELKKSPAEVSGELAAKINDNLVAGSIILKAVSVGPYLNIFIKPEILNEAILTADLKSKKSKEKIMIEYSAPNPFKSFHIGHFRNTALGDGLKRIFEFSGVKVIAANLLNDSGMHVAKCLWAYLKYFQDQEPKESRGEWLGEIYAKACKLSEENEENMKEVETAHLKIEAGDEEMIKYWQELKAWSMAEFYRIYEELGVKFDRYYFDKDLVAGGKEIVQKMLQKGLAQESEGAIIVDLEQYKLGKVVLIKTDGSALYITKDLFLAEERFREYQIDGIVYVVGMEQNLHFRQLFKMLELSGLTASKNCYHLSYEHIRLPGGKMSSRVEGGQVLYSELFSEAFNKLKEETKKRHSAWKVKEIEQVARVLTLGAIKFWVLKHDNNQQIIFDLGKALSFEGDTGPYLQYTYARINSIKVKAGGLKLKRINYSLLKEPAEKELINSLGGFIDAVAVAKNSYKPSVIANYLLNLAHSFNTFYHQHKVLELDNEELTLARLKLINATAEVLAKGLELLGIDVAEEM